MRNEAKTFWTREYQRHIDKMIGVCYRYVQNRETAEDLAHDAFLKAIEKADSFRWFGNFEHWLMRIAVNTALKYLRDTRKVSYTEEMLEIEAAEEKEDLDDEFLAEDIMVTIRKAEFSQNEILDAIAQLPEHHRLVLNLHVFERLTHKEIAKLLNITPNTSKSHLMRARKELQQILFTKSKEKEKKRMFILPVLFGTDSVFDKYCRQQLSGFGISPIRPLTEHNFPAAASKPLPTSLKLRSMRIPLTVGAATVTVSAMILPFLLSPKEKVPAPMPITEPTPIAADSCMYVEEDPETVSADSIPRPNPNKQATAPPKKNDPVTADTSAQAPKQVVIKKMVRKRHHTVVIDNHSSNE